MRGEAKSWKSNSRKEDVDDVRAGRIKKRTGKRHGKFATGMRTTRAKEANARFITLAREKERDRGIRDGLGGKRGETWR